MNVDRFIPDWAKESTPAEETPSPTAAWRDALLAGLVAAVVVGSAVLLAHAAVEPADAVIIRNVVAPHFGEPRLSVELLRVRHPLVLGEASRAAIDQRVSRLRKRIGAGDLPPKTGTSFRDLIQQALDDERNDP